MHNGVELLQIPDYARLFKLIGSQTMFFVLYKKDTFIKLNYLQVYNSVVIEELMILVR